MTHEIDVTRQWDGLDKTPVGRVASKVIDFPEHVSRLILDKERADQREMEAASLCAIGGLLLLVVTVVVKMVTR